MKIEYGFDMYLRMSEYNWHSELEKIEKLLESDEQFSQEQVDEMSKFISCIYSKIEYDARRFYPSLITDIDRCQNIFETLCDRYTVNPEHVELWDSCISNMLKLTMFADIAEVEKWLSEPPKDPRELDHAISFLVNKYKYCVYTDSYEYIKKFEEVSWQLKMQFHLNKDQITLLSNVVKMFYKIEDVEKYLESSDANKIRFDQAVAFVTNCYSYFDYKYNMDDSYVSFKEISRYNYAFVALCSRFTIYKGIIIEWERTWERLQRLSINSKEFKRR
jgi:hypothetical protein